MLIFRCVQGAIDVLLVVLVTDFASGLLHWLEDSYGRANWPISGKLVTIPNVIHHHDPRYFTKHTWRKSADVLLGLGAIIVMCAVMSNVLTWHVVLLVLLGINANEFHKWAHQNRRERPRIATWLQNMRILQTPAQHAKHHCENKDSYYCVITNLVNPVLEELRFWRTLESCVFVLFGVEKRKDTSLLGPSTPDNAVCVTES